jgi:hypothetical protein
LESRVLFFFYYFAPTQRDAWWTAEPLPLRQDSEKRILEQSFRQHKFESKDVFFLTFHFFIFTFSSLKMTHETMSFFGALLVIFFMLASGDGKLIWLQGGWTMSSGAQCSSRESQCCSSPSHIRNRKRLQLQLLPQFGESLAAHDVVKAIFDCETENPFKTHPKFHKHIVPAIRHICAQASLLKKEHYVLLDTSPQRLHFTGGHSKGGAASLDWEDKIKDALVAILCGVQGSLSSKS